MGTDGLYSFGGLTLVGSTLYGTMYYGGSAHDGVLFSVNTDGSNFQVLHAFTGADGPNPGADVSFTVVGSRLFGTTDWGGTDGDGTLFSINTDGSDYQVVHSFVGGANDGAVPEAGLTLVGSTFFGTTIGGGPDGAGTVFSINTNGTGFQVVHSFSGGATDGASPGAALTLVGSTLYGTTGQGGAAGDGTVFSMNTDGSNFQILHAFSGADGSDPSAGLTLVGSTLYGTTYQGGGANDGTVFSINVGGAGFQTVQVFNGANGANPAGALTVDGSSLFGTTLTGGNNGYGTVFSFPLATATWTGAAGDNLWSDPDNWSGDHVPGPGDGAVVINTAGTSTIVYDATAGATSIPILDLGANDTLSINGGSLAIEQSATVNGNLEVNAGTLSIGGNIVGTGTLANSGTLNANGGANTINIGVPFDNQNGTIDVESGTLAFSNSAGTSTGGSFQAAQGATLSLGNIGTLTGAYSGTGSGSVSLSSGAIQIGAAGAVFNFPAGMLSWSGGTIGGSGALNNSGTLVAAGSLNLNASLSNSGTFNWSGGTISGTGSLSNSGTVDANASASSLALGVPLANTGSFDASIGPGDALNETGNLALTSTSSVVLQLGGAPASGQFGQLNVTGLATLAGSLQIDLQGNYGPNVGDAFTVMNYASETGDFSSVETPLVNNLPVFAATVNPTNVVVTAAIAGADLSPTAISFNPTVLAGQPLTVNYTVSNLQSAPTRAGQWTDSIYLSADGTIDSSAILLGTVSQSGTVAGNGSYTGTLTVPGPAVLPGNYQIVVQVDSDNQVADSDPANNTVASSGTVAIGYPTVSPGNPTSSTIQAGQSEYFEIDPAAGSDVTLTTQLGEIGTANVFVSQGSIPTPTTNQFSATANGATLTLPILDSVPGRITCSSRG